MPTKRKILEGMTKAGLLSLARQYEITGLTGLSKVDIVDALASNRSLKAEEFLATFSRDDLKSLCQLFALNTSGREKLVLIERLLGREPGESQTTVTRNGSGEPMAKRKAKKDADGLSVEDYRHAGAKRKNNPPAKIAAEGTVPAMPKIHYSYSPRRPPVLRFDPTGKADGLPELLEKATKGPLSAEEAKVLADALRNQQPWLEWAGKQEQESSGFAVDPVALHIHERISAQAILKVAAREDVERSLFSDPQQEYHEAVQFYKHDVQWTNRLILGDSAQVMASLAHREDLAGKVQMIYMDPPYGIRYGSNFQPEIGNRDVTDKASDLTREPEMVKAYRDIWNIGIHSYLAYLRDRLIICRSLLTDSGSLFLQISDQNVHLVRQVIDQVFGPSNFAACIAFYKTSSQSSKGLPSVVDYLLHYARDLEQMKFRRIGTMKKPGERGAKQYVKLISPDMSIIRNMTNEEVDGTTSLPDGWKVSRLGPSTSSGYQESRSKPYPFEGKLVPIKQTRHWSYDPEPGKGMERLYNAGRIRRSGASIATVLLAEDNPLSYLDNVWLDTGTGSFTEEQIYVVQTAEKVVQRCLLMTTDPGDLVLDPTCGSGTTATVAEEWGRRWVTIDTSRVAISLARQRMLCKQYEYFQLCDENKGVQGGFTCRTVPHVALGDVARNENLDPIFAKHKATLDGFLKSCNDALGKVTQEIRFKLDAKLMAKQQKEGKRAVTDADNRRWQLPKKGEKFEHWTVPFDTDPDWPKELQAAVTEYRKAWRAKMDEVNACIAANAEQEELVDQPEVVKGVVRVSGPFTVEAVQPPEISLGDVSVQVDLPAEMFGGAPEELNKTFDIRPVEPRNDFEVKNVDAYLDQMTRLLSVDGVRFPNNKEMRFTRLERLVGHSGSLHADGRWTAKGDEDADPEGRAMVAVGFGPQYGPVTAKQVEDLIRSANRRGYDSLVIAGFSFDGAAQAIIEEEQHPNLRIHMAHIRPDVNPGMAGLLKDQPGSQLFTVFGQPRTRLSGPDGRGDYVVHMEGVDIYDPVANIIRSTEDSKVAAWFVDGDYDGRTFCITQAFFPDQSAWEKLAKALKAVVDDDAFKKLSGTVSLPFPPGRHKCVAVKVIDPRGNEVMQVHRIGAK